MKSLRIILSFFLTVLVASTGHAFTAYKWVDEKNVVHFTDELRNVAPQYRGAVEKVTEGDLRRLIIVHSPVLPSRGFEAKPETDERGEGYSTDRMRLWKERLHEAEANYEKAHQAFMSKARELAQMRFGSRTQYKMKIIELDDVNQTMGSYEAQIVEAREMLRKLSNETSPP